jgi:hypothetical protein
MIKTCLSSPLCCSWSSWSCLCPPIARRCASPFYGSIRSELTSFPASRGLLISAAHWSLQALSFGAGPTPRVPGRSTGRDVSGDVCSQHASAYSVIRLGVGFVGAMVAAREPASASAGGLMHRHERSDAVPRLASVAVSIAIASRARGPVIAQDARSPALVSVRLTCRFVLPVERACAMFCRARMLGTVSVRDAPRSAPVPPAFVARSLPRGGISCGRRRR